MVPHRAVWASRCRRELLGRAAGSRMRRPRSTSCVRQDKLADRGRRHRALFQGADAGAGGGAADAGRSPCARPCAQGSTRKASRRCMRSLRSAIRSRPQRLNASDRAAISRALEVMMATGRSLAEWHKRGPAAALLGRRMRVKVFLAPDRGDSSSASTIRFDAMLEAGALDEVRGAWRPPPRSRCLPAMKAHGVPWLIRHLGGRDFASRPPRRPPRPIPAITPSGSSPGSGTHWGIGRRCLRPRPGPWLTAALGR